MRLKGITVMILSAIVISSCGSNNSDNFVVDLDAAPGKEVVLRFEDLVEDVKVVALETRDDLILPGRIGVRVTPDYIVTTGMDEINQFDKGGNFIRKLAARGRGPNEFAGMITSLVDGKRSMLYIMEYLGRSNILRVDLTTGDFLDPIKYDSSFWGEEVDDKGNIVAIRDKNYYDENTSMVDTLVRVFFINGESGKIKDLPVCFGDPRKEQINVRKIDGELFFYDCVNSDTVYRFDYDKVEPYKVLKVSGRVKDDRMGTGNKLTLMRRLGEYLLILKELREIGDRGYPVTVSEEYVLVDERGGLSYLNQVIIEKYNIRQSTTKLIPISSGDYLYYCFDAPRFISLLEQALTDETTTDKQRKEINNFLSEIDENDNHIIIYGKKK